MADMAVVQTAFNTARSMGASEKVMLALFEAAIVESGFRNLNYGADDSVGYLQQRPSQGWPNPMDVPTATRSFVSRATPIQNNYATAGQLAQAVQRSAFPLKYDAAKAQASALLAQVSAGGYSGAGLDITPTGLPGSEAFKDIKAMLGRLQRKENWIRIGLLAGGFALCGIAVRSQLP